MCAFEYAYFMLATGAVPNAAEMQILVELKIRMQGDEIRRESVRVLSYQKPTSSVKASAKVAESSAEYSIND